MQLFFESFQLGFSFGKPKVCTLIAPNLRDFGPIVLSLSSLVRVLVDQLDQRTVE